jgi:hypothetical protein
MFKTFFSRQGMDKRFDFKGGSMIRQKAALCILLAVFITLAACGPSKKTGNINGRLIFGKLDEQKPQAGGQAASRLGLPNAMIVLCQVDQGLPKGPVVADANEKNPERIGVIRARLKAITDANGQFRLTGVPVGTYLVLFHLLPDVLTTKGENWGDGMIVTEADVDGSLGKIPPAPQEFWKTGGFITGSGDWNSQDGFTLKEGTVGSTYSGFCFSVQNQKATPIVEVKPDATVEILLTTNVMPGQIER